MKPKHWKKSRYYFEKQTTIYGQGTECSFPLGPKLCSRTLQSALHICRFTFKPSTTHHWWEGQVYYIRLYIRDLNICEFCYRGPRTTPPVLLRDDCISFPPPVIQPWSLVLHTSSGLSKLRGRRQWNWELLQGDSYTFRLRNSKSLFPSCVLRICFFIKCMLKGHWSNHTHFWSSPFSSESLLIPFPLLTIFFFLLGS